VDGKGGGLRAGRPSRWSKIALTSEVNKDEK